MRRIIITVAPVGSVPRKKDTPHIPVTPDEISEDVLECYKADAAIAHIHARDEEQDSVYDEALFDEISQKIKTKAPDMVVQISTGGRAGLTCESRS